LYDLDNSEIFKVDVPFYLEYAPIYAGESICYRRYASEWCLLFYGMLVAKG